MTSIHSIAVFCGAQPSVDDQFLKLGADVGRLLAEKNITITYGAGGTGMMGAVAGAALKARGHVVGVVPSGPIQLEPLQPGLTELIHVSNMHERKRRMFALSEAALILPGGMGTLDEFFEMLTWHQIGLHNKPMIIFNHQGYWDPLIALLRHVVASGFARAETLEYFQECKNLRELMTLLQ